ncbi:GEVED domain-containing protein [Chitinophagaceae bacterium MMS25-I14]
MKMMITPSTNRRDPATWRWGRKLLTNLILPIVGLLAGFGKASAYCNTGLGGGSYAWISSVSITGTTLNNPSGMAASYYTAWPASGSTTATLLLGTTYTLNTTYDNSLGGAIASLWIDYNQNGIFEASEWQQITTNANTVATSVTIPTTALTGTTGMRIRSRGNGNINGAGDACTSFGSGETEDYTITIASPVPCSGMPTAGAAVASPSLICAGNTAFLTLSGATVASGLAYQWQYYDIPTSTWMNVTTGTGGTTAGYTTGPLTASTQYRCQVTCTNGTPATATSTATTANVNTVITPPYNENFESITSNNALPNCMTATNVGSYVFTYTAPTGSYNQTNHTPAGSKFASFHWSANDYLFTPAIYLTAGAMYQYSFWYITDGYSGWTTLQPKFGTSATAAAMTTNIGSGVSNATNTTYQQYVSTFIAPTTGVYYFGLYCNANSIPWYLSVDDISIVLLPPCSGQPTAGTITPSGPISGCPGTSYFFTTSNTTTASGLTYQWLQQTNGSTTWAPVTGGSGATSLYFTTPPLSDTVKYRMRVACTASGLADTTPAVTVNVPRVPYASLPFVEDFESWSTRCSTTDIPSASWTNVPSTGNNSWRRDDQGASANWTYPTSGFNPPYSVSGAHSARFAGYYATPGQFGDLDLYINCSTVTGAKELDFFLKTQTGSTYPNDSLKVMMSTNGGGTFTQIAGIGAGTGGWDLQSVPVVSDSPRTIIRFLAKDDYQYYGDIAIDYVRVLPPCSGTPTAGTMTPVTPCANTDFTLSLQGNTQAAGLTYQWQQATSLSSAWSNVPAGNTMIATGNISAPTYFRCIVTCSNSNLADTTAPYLVQLATFYYCYCGSAASSTADDDIGNVTINTYPANVTLMTNGTASPLTYNAASINTYTDFRYTVPPITMYLDSVYKLNVTQINQYGFYNATVSAFIDYDHSGAFDATEKVFTKITSNTSTPANVVSDTFSIPPTAQFNITGMRIILVEGSGVTINPCGTYTWGETEDYLVNIKYPPCNGPTNAGTATTSDTSMCIGYSFLLTDTTHEMQRSGLYWDWVGSANNGNTWTQVPGSTGKDTVNVQFTGSSWYRLRMVCNNTGDTTYSNTVKVNIKPAYKCYCYSIATGGINDTSDIGSVTLGGFVMNTGGPHLRNPRATRGRTDYTDFGPIDLFADSTYELDVYHIMNGSNHADARLTVFMDFNNNLQYDIPSERIPLTSDISTANGWYMINNITIPTAVVPDVPTGMRLILNNNVGPNSPSDDACGAYTSGETEDYTVVFHKNPTGVNNLTNVQNLGLYPNPTTGKFNISFTTGTGIKNIQITVTTLTGQQIMVQNFTDISHNFSHEFNLGDQARGVYFVEINADGQRAIRKVVLR